MDITEAQLSVIFGGLLIFGFLVAYPALVTALALLRAERTFGTLFWHIVHAIDRRRG